MYFHLRYLAIQSVKKYNYYKVKCLIVLSGRKKLKQCQEISPTPRRGVKTNEQTEKYPKDVPGQCKFKGNLAEKIWWLFYL